MKISGAILHGVGREWTLEEFELGGPVAGEVQVRLAASGLCHSDHHFRTGDLPPAFFPLLAGHEGAGVVTKVGVGVEGLAEGDHVVLAFLPACGTCRMCARGRQNLCDRGADNSTGLSVDGTYRAHLGGNPLNRVSGLGTFAPYVTTHHSSVIKIENDIPLNRAALLGCGVCTGWGSAVSAGGVQPGDNVVVIGVGGIGINAVQGASHAGARFVVAVDPVEFKREQALKFGATHAFASIEEAAVQLPDLTWGVMSDVTILTPGVIEPEMIQQALDLTGKGGTVVVTALAGMATMAEGVPFNSTMFTLYEKRLQGAIFGGASPRSQIPTLLNLYRSGILNLDDLVTRTYRHDQINEGYADMLEGRNIRGIIEYTEADY
ncbi:MULTISPECIES: NDMA-dependent alcohol dehydrogenase [Rhodococcus]|uniref:alcohol dehydrogenase n=1 Tax=Rhodococcus pseudokoreensis TaxID=2811421 RepID=A0A974W2N4_9NOCA|nr:MULTISPECIES: NDMA-dependent alcohol dehydrogenase [Rhodococcus]MBV6760720.1 NDMA-dependent alcohol dehydrogenase [Rhodococcus opacus]QSE89854.1 NDMA-dependent alcohol dehydrogenase [Rhodococcus pseudokoreensis]